MRIAARRFDTRQTVAIELDGAAIAQVVPLPDDEAAACPSLPWVAPGWVDLQVNGYAGCELTTPQLTAEQVGRVAAALDAAGVVRWLPTVTTHAFDVMQHALRTIDAACSAWSDVARRIPGIHLEGPYLTAEDGPRGAHPREHIRAPKLDEFHRLQEAAGGRIRLLTLAPEWPGAEDFIRRLVAEGVVVALGHTAADSDAIRRAVDAGARLSTHLGNGAHPLIRRHPNYIWDQLADDRLWASLIVDGCHLPPAVVKSFVRAKTPSRCLLVSDVTGMAGMPPGRYPNTSLGDVEVLDDGRLVPAGRRDLLAGASRPIGCGVANVMQFAEVDLAVAVEMATVRPAELLGLPRPALAAGAAADLVLFDLAEDATGRYRLDVRATIQAGQQVFAAPAA